jgi:hypothetical protein
VGCSGVCAMSSTPYSLRSGGKVLQGWLQAGAKRSGAAVWASAAHSCRGRRDEGALRAALPRQTPLGRVAVMAQRLLAGSSRALSERSSAKRFES